jgi:hypothetical protein
MTQVVLVVYAPTANCGGVCVVEITVLATSPHLRSVPTVEAEQFPHARIVEVPAVHAAKMIALVFAACPGARRRRGHVRPRHALARVPGVGRDVRAVVGRRAGVGVREREDRQRHEPRVDDRAERGLLVLRVDQR